MNQNIRLVQLDGKIPNLALMKLSHWHKARGHRVFLAKQPQPSLFEPRHYDAVYGSAIFTKSAPSIDQLRQAYPHAIVGGTGLPDILDLTVESVIGMPEYERYDYGIYPDLSLEHRVYAERLPARLRFLRGPEERGQAPQREHNSGHLAPRNAESHRAARQRLLRPGTDPMAGPHPRDQGRQLHGQLQPGHQRPHHDRSWALRIFIKVKGQGKLA